MCTLIALHGCFPGVPLVVAANRDEHAGRPAEPPALRWGGDAAIVAPLDRRAGGTWLGVNGAGLFAAITNRPCREPDPERRSRGLLVLDALAAETAEEAAERLEDLAADAYNPFNLFVADGRRAALISYEGSPRRVDLAAGAHVIGNADPAAPPTPKVARIAEEARCIAHGPADDALESLAEECRSHDGDPFRATCVHAGAYGTRSSALLSLSADPNRSALRFADGPPCSARYEDFTPLLRGLLSGHPAAAGVPATRKVS